MGPFSETKVHKTHYISVAKSKYKKKSTSCHGELSAFFLGVTGFFLHFISIYDISILMNVDEMIRCFRDNHVHFDGTLSKMPSDMS